ncbi:hypothetical protein AGMMS49938_14230 [Fibrobacterales bacterium]|nr:hypothetical protein AGMMS49938_14230 [Fibrobacterales bacterium]
MRIFLTNDDGISSSNLLALAGAAVACNVGEVFVVAPHKEQSGVGHGFSYYRSLHFEKAENFPCEAHYLDGTPADCVKFALKHIYKNVAIDLVISGVNNGDNAGVASFYSGTVGAAREAALWGVPAIAVSLQKQSDEALDFALKWVAETLRNKHFTDMPKQTLWNFNVPPCTPENPCKGVRVSTTSNSMFDDYYVESDKCKDFLGNETAYLVNEDSPANSLEKNENGVALQGVAQIQGVARKSYNLMGNKVPDTRENSDDWWLSQGYASLSPQHINLTDEREYQRLRGIIS